MKRLSYFLVAVLVVTMLATGHAALAAVNLISNPSMETAGTGTLPQGWLQGKWGTNTTTFAYPVAGIDGVKAAKVTMTKFTSGDAKWYFQEVPVIAGQSYTFSDSYTATVTTRVTAQYHMTNGSYLYVDLANPAASAAWNKVTATITAPAGASSVTIFHLIEKVGSLTTDNYSLTQNSPNPTPLPTPTPTPTPVPTTTPDSLVSITFDDGWASGYQTAFPILKNAKLSATYYIVSGFLNTPEYMTTQNMLDLQSAGMEIGSHSKTHPFLTQLPYDQQKDEIAGSRTALLNLGVKSVTTFAYPYDDYNAATDQIVQSSGYLGSRKSDEGFNTKTTSKWSLVTKSVESNVTVEQIKSWIDQAKQNKQWLILLVHQVDTNGGQYSITPTNFQQVVDYLKTQNTTVVTAAQGLSWLNP